MGNRTKPPAKPQAGEDKKRKRSAKRERRHIVWRIIGYSCLAAGACITVFAGAAVGYVTSLLKGLPTISADKLTNLSSPSVVYDKNGKVIGRFAADGDRQPITSVNQVSKHLTNAFVAAEDKTFYTNIGINPIAIGRAVAQDVVSHHIMSGASTITQQTVKLAVFPDQDQTMKRKVQEAALALEVNHLLTKDEILTDYMNWVYMGRMGTQNVYGVKLASEIMFHKDVQNLTLAESAFLASIPNNANIFSPYDHKQNVVKREHYILDQMLLNKMISQSEYDAAMKVDVTKELQTPASTATPYPYILRDNVEPLVAQYLVSSGKYSNVDDAKKALPTAGFQIYTTIDKDAQDGVDAVLKNKALFGNSTIGAVDQNGKPIKGKDGKQLRDLYEAGVTLIDNQSGGIAAIGGGRDYDTGAYIDHSNIPRQPGSSIKPLLDYGPAVDMHQLSPASPLWDAPLTMQGGDGKVWSPKDDEPGWRGIVTARDALAQSYNVPAIRVLQQITPQSGGAYLEKMGISPDYRTIRGQRTITNADLTQLPSAIGGLTYGVTVQQMTSAYSTFANQGVWRPPYIIAKVTDKAGNTIYEHQPESHKVFSAQTAYIMTDMMHDVVYHGTATAIGSHFPNAYISGKTGTTDNQTDGWFVGYTQKYTMGIWMGYDYHESISTYPVNFYNLKFTLWNKMMDPLMKKNPATTAWQKPPGIVSLTVCKASGQLPSDLCKNDHDLVTDLFIQGTEPTSTCKTHVTALYTTVGGKRYLATTNTPPGEVQQGVFIVPPGTLPPGVTTNDSYEYLPTAPDPRGGSVLQAPASGQLQTLPSPTNVQAVLAKGSVQLSWGAVNGATGYTVWRATSPNGPFTNVAGPLSSTSYTDAALPKSGGLVFYQVYAASATGMSGPSASVPVDLGPGAGPGHTGGGGTGNTTGHGGGAGGDKGTGTGNGTGLPDLLWPSERHYKSRP